jgi:hypothetical protein
MPDAGASRKRQIHVAQGDIAALPLWGIRRSVP